MRPCLDWRKPSVLIVLVFLLPGAAIALPDDRDQPIRIEADEALRDEKQGFTRYEGHVRMDQGSLHIEADEITVYHDDKEADRILATGKPRAPATAAGAGKGTRLRRAPTPSSTSSTEDRIQLRENANIEQEGSIVTGDSIDYLMNEQLVKAGSDKNSESSRVKVVIPAGVVSEEER